MIEPNGLCAGCLQPTDTGLATVGEAEWHMAFAVNLGWSVPEAETIVETEPGMVTKGRYPVQWRVCRACVQRVTDRVEPVLILPYAQLPVIGQLV
jgi:hypothetical protein